MLDIPLVMGADEGLLFKLGADGVLLILVGDISGKDGTSKADCCLLKGDPL